MPTSGSYHWEISATVSISVFHTGFYWMERIKTLLHFWLNSWFKNSDNTTQKKQNQEKFKTENVLQLKEGGTEHQKLQGKRWRESTLFVNCLPTLMQRAGACQLSALWIGITWPCWLAGVGSSRKNHNRDSKWFLKYLWVGVIIFLMLWRVSSPPVTPDSSDSTSFLSKIKPLS